MKTNQHQPPFARASQLQELARQQIGCVYNADCAPSKPQETVVPDAARRFAEIQADLVFQRKAAGGKIPAAQEAKFAAEMDALWLKMTADERAKADPTRAVKTSDVSFISKPAEPEPVRSPLPSHKLDIPAAAHHAPVMPQIHTPPVAAPAPQPAPQPEPVAEAAPPAPEKAEEIAAASAPAPAEAEAAPADDGLDALTFSALKALAKSEGVPFKDSQNRATLLQLIRQKRGQA